MLKRLLVVFLLLHSLHLPSAHAIDFAAPSRKLIEKQPFELKASKVLPQSLRSEDKLFEVSERVVSDGFLNRYQLRGDFGVVTLRGTALLTERINELRQLRDLKATSTSSVVLDATGDAAVKVVTAPGRAIGSLISAVRDPGGTWKTIKEVPSGVVGLFEYAGDEASKAFQTADKAVGGESKERKNAREKLQTQAEKESQKYALRWAGFSSAEKRWYSKLGVDPYTDNEPLRDEIKRVATAESAVNVVFKFVPGVGGIALVGDVNKVLKYSKDLAAFSDPNELRNKNRAALKEAKFSDSAIEEFFKSSLLTPTLQTALVQMAIALAPVKGSDSILRQLGRAKNRESAILLLENVSYLALFHRIKPIKELIGGFGVPIAVIEDETAVIALPTDTVFYTSTFARDWSEFLVEAKARKIAAIEVRLRSDASKNLKQALDKDGIFVFERVAM